MAYTPVKDNARTKVSHAIKTGRLVRPSICEECHQPGPVSSIGRAMIQAHHHKGYEFPLDVKWLCPSCHFRKDQRADGEFNPLAKLDFETVAKIRAKRAAHGTTMRALAEEFGVSRWTISSVVRNKTWISKQ